MKVIYLLSLSLLFSVAFPLEAQTQERAYRVPQFAYEWDKSGPHPDHIVLNLTEDPATSMSVTWRTNTSIVSGYAEIALATAAPKFWRNAKTIKASTETLDLLEVPGAEVINNYHSVTFTDLLPDTLYAYRVGNGDIWSEWFHFRTASQEPKPFSFLYVGDAQNFVLELWSRLIREGYRQDPNADFIIHAGDLINNAHHERQWHEWFTAGGWIHSMLPSIATPGNHEFQPLRPEDWVKGLRQLSAQWQPQFTLPENGIDSLEALRETVYYVDYQDTRIISLNSTNYQEEQAPWLEEVLASNDKKWTVVTFHHPLFSASERRDNEALRAAWKPILDKYRVDLVLQGHDHSYARGRAEPFGENVVSGVNARDLTGTVYVVSVSGGKMYKLRPNAWEDFDGAVQDRGAENTQLIQLINIDGDKLTYQSFTATGQLYDAFDLIKQGKGVPNRFVERKDEAIPYRNHKNTIAYEDRLPEDIQIALETQYEGFEVDRVTYYDEPDFNGYSVRMYKEDTRLDLKCDVTGKVLEENRRGG